MEPDRHPPFPARQRLELHHELHARPTLPAPAPCVVSSWVQWGMAPALAERALATLCLAVGAAEPAAGVRHHVLRAPEFALKYERHGEFVSWQVNRPLAALPAHADDADLRSLLHGASALPALPDAFVALVGGRAAQGAATLADTGEMIAATHVVMLRADVASLGFGSAADWLQRCQGLLASGSAGTSATGPDDAGPPMGAWIADARRGAILTQLRLGVDGFIRFLMLDFDLSPEQAAREAQRLCEIEAYRMLAMLGFPLAQQEAGKLAELERALQGTIDAMANEVEHDDQQAFDTLTRLAAEVEHATARTRYRFSATRAYHRIVQARLAELREERIEGVRTLTGFLGRRFDPAMALCESTNARMTDIAERINRAVNLARVRVEQRREAGNQELLRALAERQRQQLILQQTVEGLSVVAISYYALGLVGYLAKAAKGLRLPGGVELQPDVVVGVAILPVVLGVAWFLRRLRRHLAH